jgi:hypothetical protein
MRRLLAAIAALAAASGAPAQASQAPKLTIGIVVDQLTPELLNEYRPHLRGGLARIAAQPAPAGQKITGQKVVVSGRSSSASPAATQRWTWNGTGFVSDVGGPAPRTVPLANSAVQKLVRASEPALVSPPVCAAKARPGGRKFARAAGDYAAFSASPSIDGATLALAAGLIQDLKLGRDAAPDLLTIDLAATDAVAKTYGSGSEEMCLDLFSLDRELGDFLRVLDGMKLDYAVELKR